MPNTPDIDVSALAEALNNKLDLDGYNATNDIKEMMANMGIPDYDRGISISIPSGSPTPSSYYTVPYDGYITVLASQNGSNPYLYLLKKTSTTTIYLFAVCIPSYTFAFTVPVKAGMELYIQTERMTNIRSVFYPCVGTAISNNS